MGIVAHHLKPHAFSKSATPVGDGAFRRLARESRPRAARARRDVGLPRADRARSTARPSTRFLERARALGVEHRAAGADRQGPPSARARRRTRARGWARSCDGSTKQQLDGHVQTLDEGLALRPNDRRRQAGSAYRRHDGKVQLEMNRVGRRSSRRRGHGACAPRAAAQEPEKEPIGRFAARRARRACRAFRTIRRRPPRSA